MRRQTLRDLEKKDTSAGEEMAEILETLTQAFFELRRIKPKTVGISMHLDESGAFTIRTVNAEITPQDDSAKNSDSQG